jgi:hypothetical protein
MSRFSRKKLLKIQKKRLKLPIVKTQYPIE